MMADWARWLTVPGMHMGSLIAEGWDAYSGASQWHEVPAVEPSLGLALGAVLDRSFATFTQLATGAPGPDRIRRFNADAVAMRSFLETRGWLDDPAAYHAEPPPVLDWRRRDHSVWLGPKLQRYQHLIWDSGYEPRPDEPGRDHWLARRENRRMHAYVLEHPGEPRPWLMCLHGFAMGSPLVTLNGFRARQLHEELGLNLIFPCLPLHGPRGAGRISGVELLEPDYLNLMHTFSHAIWDIRSALGWVRGRGALGVGLYGISLGGYLSALAASLVADLACVIATIPMTDLTSAARENEPWIFGRDEPELELDWEATRALTHVVSPLAIPPKVPRERLFICAGTADRVVRPNHARALWRHWGRPEIHWLPTSHVLGMMHPSVPGFIERSLRTAGMV